MPELDFYFSGEIRGAKITTVAGPQGNSIDVSGLTPDELVRKLRTGEYTVTLGNYLYQKNRGANVVTTGFRPAEPIEPDEEPNTSPLTFARLTFTEEQVQYLADQRRDETDCDLDVVIGVPRKES